MLRWLKLKIALNRLARYQIRIDNILLFVPFSSHELQGILKAMVQGQQTDAKRKFANRHHWGRTGELVSVAASDIDVVVIKHIEASPDSFGLSELLAIKRDVEHEKALFIESFDADDESGYGRATFGEFLTGLDELAGYVKAEN
ncbi:hypothetical protein LNL84_02305 [Vibrio sp. ZSDZ34]|uniref:Uncharacterized protein n=1 Tax=Vibrio gelatinilyticus TaxID=2893468 RepID=A0A9X2AXG4_9VIBR|nr:hypothetical protein [Vibrio gelatinilyticus]MCJ2375658.1 hypothetical protein [Vibrio gelatinilyticus]